MDDTINFYLEGIHDISLCISTSKTKTKEETEARREGNGEKKMEQGSVSKENLDIFVEDILILAEGILDVVKAYVIYLAFDI